MKTSTFPAHRELRDPSERCVTELRSDIYSCSSQDSSCVLQGFLFFNVFCFFFKLVAFYIAPMSKSVRQING